MTSADEPKLPIKRYKRRGNLMGLGVAVGAALGLGIGVATGQVAPWLSVGMGIGVLTGGLLQRRRSRMR